MATQDPTANYGWNLPDVAGDSGAWGTILNSLIGDDADSIDFHLDAAMTKATAAMPKAGGAFTGEIGVISVDWTVSTDATISGAETIDLAAANLFHHTITGATVYTIDDTTIAAGGAFVMIIVNGGTSITWDAAVKWASGTPPTLTVAGTDMLTFVTADGGATWLGAVAIEDAS
jgi:hypothetical protein